jgi:hypothetical protein
LTELKIVGIVSTGRDGKKKWKTLPDHFALQNGRVKGCDKFFASLDFHNKQIISSSTHTLSLVKGKTNK